MTAPDWIRIRHAIEEDQGSTRALALMRIGIGLVVLAEWGDSLILVRNDRPIAIAIGVSTLVTSITTSAGIVSRLSSLLLAVSCACALSLLGGNFVHHHTQMMMLAAALLAVSPCGRSFSVDRWLAARRARLAGTTIPAESGYLWGQYLLRLLVSSVYLWGLQSKANPAFVSGARIEQLYMHFYGTSDLPGGAFHATAVFISWFTIVTELALGVGLWFPRFHRILIPVGVVFHLLLYYLLPVYTFSALMLLLYLAFVPPETVHRVIDDQVERPRQS